MPGTCAASAPRWRGPVASRSSRPMRPTCSRRRLSSSPGSGTSRAQPRARAHRRRRGAPRARLGGGADARHLRRHAAAVRGQRRRRLGPRPPCRAGHAPAGREGPAHGLELARPSRAGPRCSTASTARTSTSPTPTPRGRPIPASSWLKSSTAGPWSPPSRQAPSPASSSTPSGAGRPAPVSSPTRWHGQETRDPLPRRRRRPRRQGRPLRGPPRHRRPGGARYPLLGAGRRRARVPRYHRDARGSRAAARARRPRRRGALDPVHRRRRCAFGRGRAGPPARGCRQGGREPCGARRARLARAARRRLRLPGGRVRDRRPGGRASSRTPGAIHAGATPSGGRRKPSSAAPASCS